MELKEFLRAVLQNTSNHTISFDIGIDAVVHDGSAMRLIVNAESPNRARFKIVRKQAQSTVTDSPQGGRS